MTQSSGPEPTTLTASAPVILLRGGAPGLTSALSALCNTLGLGLEASDALSPLTRVLHETRPMGLACGFVGTGAAAACHALKAVGRFDRGLPMLLVTDEDPETLGCLDAIAALSGLTDLHRLVAPPRVEDVLAFLARAGRRSGRLALMPV